jgi:transposase
MRGRQDQQVSMLAFIDVESRIPLDHPLRTIKYMADDALAELSPMFDDMYAEIGRPSLPHERLLKASLLISLYSVRSEQAFCEQLDYNLLFRWFLGMTTVEPSFDPSTFSKNRQRLMDHDVARRFFAAVVRQADRRRLLSDEHFTVDGTLIEAAASLKSFKPKDEPPSDEPPDDPGNPTVNFHGQQRANGTHQSTTDPEARLFRKGPGKEARLSYMSQVLWNQTSRELSTGVSPQAVGIGQL